jgi:hypothetical protein
MVSLLLLFALCMTGLLAVAPAHAALAVSIAAGCPMPGQSPCAPFQPLGVKGNNFPPEITVQIYLDSPVNPIGRATTARDGSFTLMGRTPQAPIGQHTVVAQTSSSGQATAFAATVSASATITIRPEVFSTPSSGSAGSTAKAYGYGFGAAEVIKLYWDTPTNFLGTTRSNALGSFYGTTAISFTVPSNATVGNHLIIAVGQRSRAVNYYYVYTSVAANDTLRTAGARMRLSGTP